MLNAILKTFRGQLDPYGFFPLRIFGGGGAGAVFCSSFSCVPNIAIFFLLSLRFSLTFIRQLSMVSRKNGILEFRL